MATESLRTETQVDKKWPLVWASFSSALCGRICGQSRTYADRLTGPLLDTGTRPDSDHLLLPRSCGARSTAMLAGVRQLLEHTRPVCVGLRSRSCGASSLITASLSGRRAKIHGAVPLKSRIIPMVLRPCHHRKQAALRSRVETTYTFSFA